MVLRGPPPRCQARHRSELGRLEDDLFPLMVEAESRRRFGPAHEALVLNGIQPHRLLAFVRSFSSRPRAVEVIHGARGIFLLAHKFSVDVLITHQSLRAPLAALTS